MNGNPDCRNTTSASFVQRLEILERRQEEVSNWIYQQFGQKVGDLIDKTDDDEVEILEIRESSTMEDAGGIEITSKTATDAAHRTTASSGLLEGDGFSVAQTSELRSNNKTSTATGIVAKTLSSKRRKMSKSEEMMTESTPAASESYTTSDFPIENCATEGVETQLASLLDNSKACDSHPDSMQGLVDPSPSKVPERCVPSCPEIKKEASAGAKCAVCRSIVPECGNDMVFCEGCNICIHQACYGVEEIPEGDWFCNPCKEGKDTKQLGCLLCPVVGGALKPISEPPTDAEVYPKWLHCKWAHVWCAWWIPEVKIGDCKTQEPIQEVENIPNSRWELKCGICLTKVGTPMQCYRDECKRAFHPTCAKKDGLRMKRAADPTDGDKVIFRAFCKEHRAATKSGNQKRTRKSKRAKFSTFTRR